MRIIFTPDIFKMQQFGGISRYFVRLAEELHALKQDPRIIAPYHINHYLRDSKFSKSGYWINQNTPYSSKLMRLWNSVSIQFNLFAERPQIVHSTFFRQFPPLITNATRIITIFDLIDEFYHHNHPHGIYLAKLKRRAIDEADLVLCISENTKQDLIRHLGTDPAKIRVTYLAADTPPAPLQAGHPLEGKPYILYVGSRYGYKNFNSFIAAYAQSGRIRKTFKLLIFGSSPLNSDELKLLELNHISQDEIIYRAGSDDDLYHCYRNADLFVYPSRYEGFGIPPLEAMSVGCPVACSETSSIPEVVGDAAFLFNPNVIESMVKTLDTALSDREQRQAKIISGYSRFSKFSWKQCAQDTLDAYRFAQGMAS